MEAIRARSRIKDETIELTFERDPLRSIVTYHLTARHPEGGEGRFELIRYNGWRSGIATGDYPAEVGDFVRRLTETMSKLHCAEPLSARTPPEQNFREAIEQLGGESARPARPPFHECWLRSEAGLGHAPELAREALECLTGKRQALTDEARRWLEVRASEEGRESAKWAAQVLHDIEALSTVGRQCRGIGRADYEDRRQQRIERLQDRAIARRTEGNRRLSQARRLADAIPLGQPILVGHHSEKRARRDRNKIHNDMRKGVAALEESERLESRARAAESNSAISSDDPQALVKLREKLAAEEASRDEMKRLNAIHRKGGWEAVANEVGAERAERLRRTARYTADDRPHPPYALTNIGANIRRIKRRIAELEEQAARPEREPENYGDLVVREEDNRVQIVFPAKPPEAVRLELRSNGFRFAPSVGAWQRHASDRAWYLARDIAKKAAGLDEA